jgi:hypothetical protein
MPVSFSEIAAGTAKVTVQTSAGPVVVEYYPNKITDKLMAEMQATNDANPAFIEFIKSWDIYDKDPSVMFPIERIAEFGIPFQVAVMRAVMSDIRPNQIAPQG